MSNIEKLCVGCPGIFALVLLIVGAKEMHHGWAVNALFLDPTVFVCSGVICMSLFCLCLLLVSRKEANVDADTSQNN